LRAGRQQAFLNCIEHLFDYFRVQDGAAMERNDDSDIAFGVDSMAALRTEMLKPCPK